jgi:ribosome biogenesis GTPase A
MNRESLLKAVFDRMFSKSIVILVLDIVNFESSQIDEVFTHINTNKHRLLVVINKIDALPTGFGVDRI